MKRKDILNKKEILIILLIIIICGVILFFQTQKAGFHEDEVYTIVSSVNPDNGLMSAYKNNDLPEDEAPIWKTKEYVKEYVTLSNNNYLNLTSIYTNQEKDNHPPVFYALVHFSTILFGGEFSKYSVFVVNIITFILSCFIIAKILKFINKENVITPTLIFYGLSIGTISMVLYQRMYMLLTLFILIYFYLTLKIYKNEFRLDKKIIIQLGITSVIGFLTQYFFAIYAMGMFIIMIIEMIKRKDYKNLKKYIIIHIIYASIGILLFIPCIYHLLISDRGIKNLANSNYFIQFGEYIKQLTYAFSVKGSTILLFILLILIFIKLTYLRNKKEERFIVLLATIPTAIFFIITVKLTSWQMLRYVMPMIPFIVITLYIILDSLIDVKYKNIIFIAISVTMVTYGLIVSEPKFLYEEYDECIEIAESNSEKSFVYVYDNYFNHMQSIPEMIIYEKTLIINISKEEIKYLIQNAELKEEDSYILCIKSYINNEEILEQIKNETEFKNITTLFIGDSSDPEKLIGNNIYLVSK